MRHTRFTVLSLGAALLTAAFTSSCAGWYVDDGYTPDYYTGTYYTGNWWPSPNVWYPSYTPSLPPVVGNGPGSVIPSGGWGRPVRPNTPTVRPGNPGAQPPLMRPGGLNGSNPGPQIPIQPLPNTNGQRPAAGRH